MDLIKVVAASLPMSRGVCYVLCDFWREWPPGLENWDKMIDAWWTSIYCYYYIGLYCFCLSLPFVAKWNDGLDCRSLTAAVVTAIDYTYAFEVWCNGEMRLPHVIPSFLSKGFEEKREGSKMRGRRVLVDRYVMRDSLLASLTKASCSDWWTRFRTRFLFIDVSSWGGGWRSKPRSSTPSVDGSRWRDLFACRAQCLTRHSLADDVKERSVFLRPANSNIVANEVRGSIQWGVSEAGGERGSFRVGIFYSERFTFYEIFLRKKQIIFPYRGHGRGETGEGNRWFVCKLPLRQVFWWGTMMGE